MNLRFLSSCVFIAHWMPATFMIDPDAQAHVSTNWTTDNNPMAEALQAMRRGDDPDTPLPNPLKLIQIGPDWISSLDGIPDLLFQMENPNFLDLFHEQINSNFLIKLMQVPYRLN